MGLVLHSWAGDFPERHNSSESMQISARGIVEHKKTRPVRNARAGFGCCSRELLNGDAAAQLAHDEGGELLNGHLLAV
jgi:hypothetical protein